MRKFRPKYRWRDREHHLRMKRLESKAFQEWINNLESPFVSLLKSKEIHTTMGINDFLIKYPPHKIEEKPQKQICSVGVCENPAQHMTNDEEGRTWFYCCHCHVKQGNPPVDWHAECMKTKEELERNVIDEDKEPQQLGS